jgi:hypothetical protein
MILFRYTVITIIIVIAVIVSYFVSHCKNIVLVIAINDHLMIIHQYSYYSYYY